MRPVQPVMYVEAAMWCMPSAFNGVAGFEREILILKQKSDIFEEQWLGRSSKAGSGCR